jgi:DNA-binding PadR family transcriptional regulator
MRYNQFEHMPKRHRPEDSLPLKPVVFQVLLTLANGERHGYGIVQDIAARTAAAMRLQPGNLYRTLNDMLEDGLVAEAGERSAADSGDERRRYYRITKRGAEVAAAEARRLEALVAEARASRLLKGTGRA